MKKILLADQSESISELLKASLEIDGFQVTIASNKKDILKKAEFEIPDLILLCLSDKLEICREIKKKDIKSLVIITSPFSDSKEIKESGADGLIQTPINALTLGKEIEGFLIRN